MDNEYNVIKFDISEDQAIRLAKHYGEDLNYLEDYEVCELLDKFIDENLD